MSGLQGQLIDLAGGKVIYVGWGLSQVSLLGLFDRFSKRRV
jgi:hypothetical protein